MTEYILQDNAGTVFAEILAGKATKIDSVYVEVHEEPELSAAKKDQEYFDSLKESRGAGYAVVPVHHTYIDGSDVHFQIMLSKSDFKEFDLTADSIITSATLAATRYDNPNKRTLVYTTVFPVPSKIASSTYNVLDICLSIGGKHA